MRSTAGEQQPLRVVIMAAMRRVSILVIQIILVVFGFFCIVLPYHLWLWCTPFLNECRRLRWNPPKYLRKGRFLATFVKRVPVYGPARKTNRFLDWIRQRGEPNVLYLIRFVDIETRETVAILERRSLYGFYTEHVHVADSASYLRNHEDVDQSGLCCWVGTYERIKRSPDEPCCHGTSPISRDDPDMESYAQPEFIGSIVTFPDPGHRFTIYL